MNLLSRDRSAISHHQFEIDFLAKLGKLSVLGKRRGEVPIVLMDDFDSDLDEVRARAVADYLCTGGCQALVATSKEGMADRIGVPFTKVLLSEGTLRET